MKFSFKIQVLKKRDFILWSILLFIITTTTAQRGSINVGLASIDITPTNPVRLAGFALRDKKEAQEVLLPLHAKALAFGNNKKNAAIIITADLIGISSGITDAVKKRLSKWVQPERITISVSHTHSGPEIGTLLNIFHYVSSVERFDDKELPVEQILHINQYVSYLIEKLEEVAIAALNNRSPALISWGQGSVGFSFNRRGLTDALDHSMPMMKITDLSGNLKAVFLSYACHAVVLGSKVNKYHGDWVGDAQRIIEERHPGAMALVAVGCAGDINPQRPKESNYSNDALLKLSKKYGEDIANEADRLLSSNLQPLYNTPSIRFQKINLPLEAIPPLTQLGQIASKDITVKGYQARLTLNRIARNEKIMQHIPYPVQVWKFGKKLNIIFLGGEVVTDYALRLKKELGANTNWIVAYANDVPCYIGSKRVIRAGNYEGEASMYYYDKPAKLKEEVEDLIIETVHQLIKK
ncbi:MAG: neutral/alkaline non-lysosomal ceramidase N-terminal domain-containing protein [Niabella sp.]